MDEIYNIKLTKNQLELLNKLCDNYSRLMVGQLDIGLDDILQYSIDRHKLKGEDTTDIMNDIKEKLRDITNIVWKDSHLGVGYSKDVNTLIDIHQVIRHKLWEDNGKLTKHTVDSYPPHHWNRDTPLMDIKSNQEYKEWQKQLLIKMMNDDSELGLYDNE